MFSKKKKRENPDITFRGEGEALQMPLSSKEMNLKMAHI